MGELAISRAFGDAEFKKEMQDDVEDGTWQLKFEIPLFVSLVLEIIFSDPNNPLN